MVGILRTIENGNLQTPLSYSPQKILSDDPWTKSVRPLTAVAVLPLVSATSDPLTTEILQVV
jgi:hypothetical protein